MKTLRRQFALMLGQQPSLRHYLQPLIALFKPGYQPGLYRAEVLSVQPQGQTSYHLWLKPEASWPGFTAGQHVELTVELNGRRMVRTFSLSSAEADWVQRGRIRLTIKQNPDGQLSQALWQQASGGIVRQLYLSAAKGQFVLPQSQSSGLLLAAGSGVAPLAAIALSQRCWLAPLQMIYYVRHSADAALLEELEQLAARQPLFSLRLVETSRDGRLDAVSLLPAGFVPQQVMACGPYAFTRQAQRWAQQVDVPAALFCEEYFRLPNAQVSDTKVWPVKWWFQGQSCDTNGSNEPLLRQAEQAGFAVQHGCRIGVCYQCVCQKLQGRVKNLQTGLMSSDGPEQIQLCVSVPQSAVSISLGERA